VAALGHPATTLSDYIDYISVEDDFVGDPACFSETLLRLPKDGQPYWPALSAIKHGEDGVPPVARNNRHADPDQPVVDIAIAATIMKLNPGFLLACRRIQTLSRRAIRFHFLVGQAQGLVTPQVLRLIRSYLPGAQVYPHRPYDDYMATLNSCDMFISPFPFGNTNGVVDAVSLGLPGICKTGPEVFEHIDEALFRRLQLPEWTIAATVEEYVQAAIRMAENFDERAALYRQLEQPGSLDALFTGRPECLGEELHRLWSARAVKN
jgi:predicted O-linked N-acetylglucosamine transferase (SPINDLY family)